MPDLLRTARYKELGKILRSARDAKGWCQKDVARLIGRPQTYISAVETGVRRVDIIEFLRLTNALELDPLGVMAQIIEVDDAP